jgi:hypothetical protein
MHLFNRCDYQVRTELVFDINECAFIHAGRGKKGGGGVLVFLKLDVWRLCSAVSVVVPCACILVGWRYL